MPRLPCTCPLFFRQSRKGKCSHCGLGDHCVAHCAAHCAWVTDLQMICLIQESPPQMTAESVLVTQRRYGGQMTSVSLSAMRTDLHI